ncbi:MAG: DUF4139 domain-containing protein [Treponema sp.]|nr:DUF4139 domain-containing protein [Treponema sp.]
MKNKLTFFVLIFLVASTAWTQGLTDRQAATPQDASQAAAQADSPLPLRRVVILSSGMTYYEHSGSLQGASSFNIPFRLNAINDALRTLVINDSASTNPSVTYQAENTLIETLRSLSVDLSDSPYFAEMLFRLRGAEVIVNIKSSYEVNDVIKNENNIPVFHNILYTGRITGIEYRQSVGINSFTLEPFLILFSSSNEGMVSIGISNIDSIRFTDPIIERDINRALDLIASSRNSHSRDLTVNLPGTARRNVTISYVIPSPVWKVSYRLDLGATRPLFQGWAIIDNDSDTDWNNVELSLVAGRPASFIQELYPPYYVTRPVMPLAIAGTAAAQTHERSVQDRSVLERTVQAESMAAMAPSPTAARLRTESAMYEMADSSSNTVQGGTVQTASGSDAGGQFEFTIRNRINLNRRMSAMFPLVESPIEARKILIYSGQGRFPRLGAEITNTTGMKLPAGPITVFDGVYAGDALIDFWNTGEKRFISFGEDLSVTASLGTATTNNISTVNISGGVMTINRSLVYSRTYSFNNSASQAKQLVIEHRKTAQTELVTPSATEETAEIYRFNVTLNANRETSLAVNERRQISERIALTGQNINSLVSYSSNQEIPANVRAALARAAELRRAIEAADASIRDVQAQRERLTTDQDRIRRNLEAAGNQTPQGQEYLRRLVALDTEIDAASASLARAQNTASNARSAYETYINGLNF